MNRNIRIAIFVAISMLALLGLSSTASAIASNEAVVALVALKGYAVVNIDACTSTLKYNFPGVTSTHGVALSSDGSKVLLGGIGSIAVIDDSKAVAGDNSLSGAVICTIPIPGISVCGMTWQNRTRLWVGDDQTVAADANLGGLQEIIFSDPSNLCSYTLGAFLLTGNSICGVNFYTPRKGRYAGQELIYLQSMFGSSKGFTDADPTVYKIDKAQLSIERKYMSRRHNASGGHMTDIMYNAPSTGGRKDVYYSTCGWERKVSGCHLPAGSHHNDINVDVNTTHTGEPHSVKARGGYLYVNARTHVGNLTKPFGPSRPYSYVLKIDEATGTKQFITYLSTGVPSTFASCGIVLTGTVGQQPP